MRTRKPALSAVLAGMGDAGARLAGRDWSASALGAPSKWPASLAHALPLVLRWPQPAFLWWGDDLVQFYNDAARALLGPRHPDALGQPALGGDDLQAQVRHVLVEGTGGQHAGWTLVPVLDEHGRAAGVLGVAAGEHLAEDAPAEP